MDDLEIIITELIEIVVGLFIVGMYLFVIYGIVLILLSWLGIIK